MKKIQLLFWILICSLSVTCAQQSFDEKLQQLYKNTVPLATTDQLLEWQEQQEVILLDIRSDKEYKVSHIPGARLVDYDSFQKNKVKDIPKNSKIVVYCSVGYRSERIGEQLIELGFSDVHNLYGGIFQWKNQDYQVVDLQNQPTEKVHTYNKAWSRWLNKGVKVYD